MRYFYSLKDVKKSLIIQLSILVGTLLIACIAHRLIIRNRFQIDVQIAVFQDPIYYMEYDPADQGYYSWNEMENEYPGDEKFEPDLQVVWENEAIPIEKIRIRYKEKNIGESKAAIATLRLTMKPEKKGNYKFYVQWGDRQLEMEKVRVGMFLTAFCPSTGQFTGDGMVIFCFLLFCIGTFVIMISTFNRLRGALINSYEAILCCGTCVYFMAVASFSIWYYIRHLLHPVEYPVWELVTDFTSGCKMLVRLSLPALVAFSFLLILSNIFLLKREGVRLQNILGIGLGFVIVGAGLASYFAFKYVSSLWVVWETTRFINIVENMAGITFIFGECILVSAMVCGYRASIHIPETDKKYIIILGCGMRKDGTPSALLRGRIDAAVSFWYRQKWETGTEAYLVLSGGQGSDEKVSEAECMRNYLVEKGFPENRLLLEDQSTNTLENMRFSKKVILEHVSRESSESKATESDEDSAETVLTGTAVTGVAEKPAKESGEDVLSEKETDEAALPPVAFVTTNYHVFRSGIHANHVGLGAEGVGARTKWWFWPNAFVRECIGFFLNPTVLIIYLAQVVFSMVVSIKLTDVMF